MTTTALTQARTIVQQLSVQEKLHLLNEITAQLIQDSANSSNAPRPAFPVFHVSEWPDDMPMRREDLYNDRGR